MPRSRGSEMPQRQSPRGPHQLRVSNSDSDPLHHRAMVDRSPKLGDRRSPRGTPPDMVNQKKLGTRIADLESQLGQAQEELKKLKDQLATAEAAKKEAQEELQKKSKKPGTAEPETNEAEYPQKDEKDSDRADGNLQIEAPDENHQETDVFEVPVEVKIEQNVELNEPVDHGEKEAKQIDISTEPPVIAEPQKLSLEDYDAKNDEIKLLKSKLEEKEKELEVTGRENESMTRQLNDATVEISSAKTKEQEMASKLSKLGEELEVSKECSIQLKKKLGSVEAAKEALEAEMKKLRVQTEQWRKAADAAAAILAGGVDMNGRISERCSSMDKHFGGVFETPAAGYAGFVSSPGMADDLDDSFGSGKKKGSGIRKFGDLWKKRSQK